MLYLLDANTLIRANREYYPMDRIPGFWTWLVEQGNAGVVKLLREIAGEIVAGTDAVAGWLSDRDIRKALILDEAVDIGCLRHVVDNGYAPNLDAVAMHRIGRDPFLISDALGREDRTVVTKENPRPTAQPQNRKVPDACDLCGVRWLSAFDFYREADFRLA